MLEYVVFFSSAAVLFLYLCLKLTPQKDEQGGALNKIIRAFALGLFLASLLMALTSTQIPGRTISTNTTYSFNNFTQYALAPDGNYTNTTLPLVVATSTATSETPTPIEAVMYTTFFTILVSCLSGVFILWFAFHLIGLLMQSLGKFKKQQRGEFDED